MKRVPVNSAGWGHGGPTHAGLDQQPGGSSTLFPVNASQWWFQREPGLLNAFIRPHMKALISSQPPPPSPPSESFLFAIFCLVSCSITGRLCFFLSLFFFHIHSFMSELMHTTHSEHTPTHTPRRITTGCWSGSGDGRIASFTVKRKINLPLPEWMFWSSVIKKYKKKRCLFPPKFILISSLCVYSERVETASGKLAGMQPQSFINLKKKKAASTFYNVDFFFIWLFSHWCFRVKLEHSQSVWSERWRDWI